MPDKSKALMPIEEKQVEFYEDELTAARVEGGTVYMPIRPIRRLLGLNWDGQRRRILRDAVLSEEVQGIVVTTTPSSKDELHKATYNPLERLCCLVKG
jgi:hypothetical protein